MKKRKLNIIDIIVILAVVAIVGVVVFKFGVIDKKSGLGVKQAYKNIEYVLSVSNVRNMTAEAFNVGDKVYGHYDDGYRWCRNSYIRIIKKTKQNGV